MPLGNLTSQFFANVYLNELDHYVKHTLKVKYYIRYVDDFVILHSNKSILEEYKETIDQFLKERLDVELHPDKSKIIRLNNSLTFLGFRVFYYHKLIKKSNLKKLRNKFRIITEEYFKGNISYDKVYDFFEGWFAYAKHAETHRLRKKFANEIEKNFPNEISSKKINRITKYIEI